MSRLRDMKTNSKKKRSVEPFRFKIPHKEKTHEEIMGDIAEKLEKGTAREKLIRNLNTMERAKVSELMKSSKSPNDWNGNADKVKAAFNGNLPDFWYPDIIASGLMDETRLLQGW